MNQHIKPYDSIVRTDTLEHGKDTIVVDTILLYDTTYSYDTVVIGTEPIGQGGRAFGYDPFASDVYNYQDSLFGEDSYYPGGFGFGDDIFFTRPDGSETRVDIRPKPLSDSFAISFPLSLSFDPYPGSVFWDSYRIPYFINGIWISTAYDTTPLVDMKKTNIFTVPDQFTGATWGISNLVVTIFYNMQPHYVPTASVNAAPGSGDGLILSATAFPNPIHSSGSLDLTLSAAANVSVVGYDVTGREVFRISKNEPAGENMVDLSGLANAHGAIMLRVNASSEAAYETKNVMLVKE